MSDILDQELLCPYCNQGVKISEIEEHNKNNHHVVGLVPPVALDFGEGKSNE